MKSTAHPGTRPSCKGPPYGFYSGSSGQCITETLTATSEAARANLTHAPRRRAMPLKDGEEARAAGPLRLDRGLNSVRPGDTGSGRPRREGAMKDGGEEGPGRGGQFPVDSNPCSLPSLCHKGGGWEAHLGTLRLLPEGCGTRRGGPPPESAAFIGEIQRSTEHAYVVKGLT